MTSETGRSSATGSGGNKDDAVAVREGAKGTGTFDAERLRFFVAFAVKEGGTGVAYFLPVSLPLHAGA